MRHTLSKSKGVTIIEFVLGALILGVAMLMLFEMSFRIYVTNLVEYALRETVRSTKIYEGGDSYDNYKLTLDNALGESDSMWATLVPAENFTLTGQYYLSYSDLISNVSYTDVQMDEGGGGYAIAEFTLQYNHSPMFSVFTGDVVPITRSTLINLEHEGWEEETP